jgi:Mn-dependent DtxR family transcriptional regulator
VNEEIRVEPLAERQRAVMRVIATYHEATEEYPSARYIARRLGVHLSTVQEHLVALTRKGWLRAPQPYAVRCWPS